MRNLLRILTLIFLFCCKINLYSQSSQISNEKELLESAVEKALNDIKGRNVKDLKQNSTKYMYCLFCFNSIDDYTKPEISRGKFYKNHFDNLLNPISIEKIFINNKSIIIKQSSNYSDYIILFTIDRKDERVGYEGSQLGIWFKKVNDKFLISGFENIP